VSASSGNLKAERWADLEGSPLPEVPDPFFSFFLS
jgi:hypothetical protein